MDGSEGVVFAVISEAMEFCSNKGYQAWFDLAKWLKSHDFLSPVARSQCFNIGRTLQRGRDPSIELSIVCMTVWQSAEKKGWNSSDQ